MLGVYGPASRWATAMGTTPQCAAAFMDYSGDWSTWVAQAGLMAKAWDGSLVPIIGLPMAREADGYVAHPPLAVYRDIAAGKRADVWTGIVTAWRDAGHTLLYLNIGWSMNDSLPWSMGYRPEEVEAWVAAFVRIVSIVRAVPGVTIRIVWAPATVSWTAAPVVSTYPGDDVVDVIALEVDNACYPLDLWDAVTNKLAPSLAGWLTETANRERYWDEPSRLFTQPDGDPDAGWGMLRHLAFAKQHGKPVGIFAGVGTRVGDDPPQSLHDDDQLPVWLAGRLRESGLPVSFVVIKDTADTIGDWSFSDGSQPHAARAWQAMFGPQSGWTYAHDVAGPPAPPPDPGTYIIMKPLPGLYLVPTTGPLELTVDLSQAAGMALQAAWVDEKADTVTDAGKPVPGAVNVFKAPYAPLLLVIMPVPTPDDASVCPALTAHATTTASGALVVSGGKQIGRATSLGINVDGVGAWTTGLIPDGPYSVHLGPVAPGKHRIEVYTVACASTDLIQG